LTIYTALDSVKVLRFGRELVYGLRTSSLLYAVLFPKFVI